MEGTFHSIARSLSLPKKIAATKKKIADAVKVRACSHG
jgi:hypothetical protein